MKKKTLFVPFAALALGWACSEHAVSPLEPTPGDSPFKLAPSGPLFDDISNNLDASIDAVAEVMPLNANGANGTTTLYLTERNGDGKNGCNLTGGTTLGLSISSNNTAVATVSPSTVTFTSCSFTQVLTITPHAAGTAAISVSQTSNTTAGTFNLDPATFTVNVSAPPNTAPTISVAGVVAGSSYRKGSVPAASCNVADAEDGNKSFPATLTSITGPNSGDGVGSQTASCDYIDAGGLEAAASITYQIIYNDLTAPFISTLLNPASPDGTNGWYKSNVSLSWTVTEGESTPTLVKTGCADKNITADQSETTYDCSASSDGGSAGPVSVKIKRDGTAPTVELTGTTPASPNGDNEWYLSDVTAAFKATDALSGFGNPSSATKTDNVTSSGEGAAVVVASPTYTDNAGNSSSLSPSFKIDKTNPTATASAPPANGNGWYNANVTVTFTGSDLASGISSCTAAAIVSAEAATQVVSGTCTDNAGRTSTPAQVTISLDKTAPTLSGAPTTAANGNGWYMNDVSVKWTCADNLSGVVTCPDNTLISAEGSNLSASALITDRADNTRSTTVSGINIDKTDPTVDAVVSPASPNGNGWYKATVTVKFNGFDAGSGILSCTADAAFSAEGKDQNASGTCTDKSGRTSAVKTVTVSIDLTPPTITGSPTTAANAKGWYKDDVSIAWTCSDALSGIVACPPNSLISTEGTNQSASASVSDKADNSASAAVSGIKLDKTNPVVTPAVSPSANSYGWRNTDVTVKFNGSDALSEIDNCDSDVTVSSEGANLSASGGCTDNAGNRGTAGVTFKIDKTAPTISGSPTSAPNVDGWYKNDVSIAWTCSDALSDVLSCPGNSLISDEGSNQSAGASVSDRAGNSASATVTGIKLDKTQPTNVAFSGGFAGGAYYYGFVPAEPSCTASDALSGVKTCVVSGYTAAVGHHTLTATATDKAGNVQTATLDYMVNSWSLNGFYQPVDMSVSGGQIVYNAVKSGSTVPFKFEIFAGSTELTTTSSVKGFSASMVACSAAAGTDEIEITSTGGTVLRYDATAGQFIQNWQTPKTPGACYRTTITTQDDSKITAYFQLK
jgi:hypothetical protein